MKNLLIYRFESAAQEMRFRQTTLERDKTKIIVAGALVAFAIVGFAILDFFYPPSGTSITVSFINRCVTLTASLIAIWMIHRQNRFNYFDLIVSVWAIIIIAHLILMNIFRPADTVAVVAWDILAIFFIYIMLPIPIRFKLFPTLFLTFASCLVWLVFRPPSWSGMGIWGVLSGYVFANIWGIWVSTQLGKLHRQQFSIYEKEHKAKEKLESALAEVKVLRGIIPICSNCQKIRNDKGYFEAVDAYISRHSDADFSHTICPDCFAELYPEIYAEKMKEAAKEASNEKE